MSQAFRTIDNFFHRLCIWETFMRLALRKILRQLEEKMDSATARLDILGKKLGHGLDTISEHIDEKINEQEKRLLEKFEKLDEDEDDPIV
jgi:hypothetical protein